MLLEINQSIIFNFKTKAIAGRLGNKKIQTTEINASAEEAHLRDVNVHCVGAVRP